MRVDRFDFDLPRALIADRPAEPRDACRLLAVAGDGRLRHLAFRDLPDLLAKGDLLVVNDTRVLPARLAGETERGEVEATLIEAAGDGLWKALARPARKLAPGTRIAFATGFAATVAARGEGGEVALAFETGGRALGELLERHGAMPLPPYIRRAPDARDRSDYQTVFAARPGAAGEAWPGGDGAPGRPQGAVAAPTAGLHFTAGLLERLAAKGIGVERATLHVGPGTFLPVRVADSDDHVMHAEWGRLAPAAAERIAARRAAGGRIVAVGTTCVRLLESAAASGTVRPFEGRTSLFIAPGHRFAAVDMMVTNFHLPRSTLFMLVCAFAGTETVKAAYAEAIRRRYRFYSYGDACLLARR